MISFHSLVAFLTFLRQSIIYCSPNPVSLPFKTLIAMDAEDYYADCFGMDLFCDDAQHDLW